MINFLNLDYLKDGNLRQQVAFMELEALDVWKILLPYTPVLAGTIPLQIDVEDSDLDVICCVTDLKEFGSLLARSFSDQKDFALHHGTMQGEAYVVCQFRATHFPIEIFGQNRPVTQQHAYRHMIIEYRLLQDHSEDFRDQIIALKKSGIKTEPAFAKILGLKGNPYDALLALDSISGDTAAYTN